MVKCDTVLSLARRGNSLARYTEPVRVDLMLNQRGRRRANVDTTLISYVCWEGYIFQAQGPILNPYIHVIFLKFNITSEALL